MDEQAAGPNITAATLETPLRCLLGSDRVTADTWQVAPLQNSFGGATGGIFRVAGSARASDGTVPFALVLKVIRAPVSGTLGAPSVGADPADGSYWKREALAYQSGFLDELPGLVAPHCYGVEEQADGAVWLWLEALQDDGGPTWPLDCYGTAARHLGQFNGAYMIGKPCPEYAWLSRHWLRDWIPRLNGFRDLSLMQREEAWRAPLARLGYAASAVLRWGWFPGWVVQIATDGQQRARWEGWVGAPAEEFVPFLGAAVPVPPPSARRRLPRPPVPVRRALPGR
jgi:hypothetical protein